MSESVFAVILLPLALEKTYTYSIPSDLIDHIKVGCRVVVVLGKRKLYTGIVNEIHTQTPEYETKPILSVFEDKPILSKPQTDLINWVASYYCCTKGEVMNAAIPSKLIPCGETKVYFHKDFDAAFTPSKYEQKILDFLSNTNVSDIEQIAAATEIKNPLKQLENLATLGIVSLNQNLVSSYKPVFENYIYLSLQTIDDSQAEIEKLFSRHEKQKEIIACAPFFPPS